MREAERTARAIWRYTVNDLASVMGLILLGLTWLALRGMGDPSKKGRTRR